MVEPLQTSLDMQDQERRRLPCSFVHTLEVKSYIEYKGRMESVDMYMNLIMTEAEEIHGEKVVEKFGRVILRGNNVLFVKIEDDL